MSNLQKIADGFPAISSPESNELLRIGSTLFILARISTFYKVKIKDGKTTDTFSNIFFLFFGGSGEGKGKVLKSFEQLEAYRDFLAIERAEIKDFEDRALRFYANEYMTKYATETVFDDIEQAFDNTQEGKKDKKGEQKKAITYARAKVKGIQPIMSDSTRPNLESTAIAVCSHDKISVSIKNDEFLIWMKRKQKESFELFEFMAESYDNGEAITKGTNTANRSVDESMVRNFPLNAIFFSSEYLMSDGGINGLLKDFFITAGARRFLTASGEELETPVYSEEEVEDLFDTTKSETNSLLMSFSLSCARFASEGVRVGVELRTRIAEDKKVINEKLKADKRLSHLSRIEVKGSPWRALKIAGLLALLNHPGNNEITLADYEEAKALNYRFMRSFKGIVERNWVDDEDSFIDFIEKHPNCTKGDLYKLPLFSKNKIDRRRRYDELIDVCSETIQTYGSVLVIEKGEDGKSSIHRIEAKPVDIPMPEGPLLNISTSTDMAQGYILQKVDLEGMCSVMENKDKENYSAGEFGGGHRKQANWLGGNNCLILDIDNENGELTLDQAKEIFKDYTYIIQPTKSHQIEKSKHGIKDRFRIVFPTSEMPVLEVPRFRAIYDAFHCAFNIQEFGDVKASGDTARFYYPSPHKAEIHLGNKMVNWRVYDKPVVSAPVKTYAGGNFSGQADNVDPTLSRYEFLKLGEKKPIKCPYHDDSHHSAFATRKDDNAVFVSCSACGALKFSH